MIAVDSPLRRLPKGLDRKQILFLDGLRHAAEITHFAHERLRYTLTEVATKDHTPTQSNQLYTAAFIDAWSIVDAFDRFRGLWLLFPNATTVDAKGVSRAPDFVHAARELRNVADHLATKAEYVVSKKGAALGVLTWFTLLRDDGAEGLSCAIVPGAVPDGSFVAVNPSAKSLKYPTDLIHLSTGGHRVCLADLVEYMAKHIGSLEASLNAQLPRGLSEEHVIATDILVKAHLDFGPPQA